MSCRPTTLHNFACCASSWPCPQCVFGAFNVLVAGTQDYPDEYLVTAGTTVTSILDQNKDGVADDPAVLAYLSYITNPNPPVLHGAPTRDKEANGDYMQGNGFVYAYSLQTWHCLNGACGWDQVRATITEEVFHMVSEVGYARVYPEQFGFDDFNSSVACRAMAAASCVTWVHPENACPEEGVHTPPPLATGTCTYSSCDCVEWFHQVALILAGQRPGWKSNLMPSTRETLLPTLPADFTSMMEDPSYHQLNAPLDYTFCGVCAPPSPPPTPPLIPNQCRACGIEAGGYGNGSLAGAACNVNTSCATSLFCNYEYFNQNASGICQPCTDCPGGSCSLSQVQAEGDRTIKCIDKLPALPTFLTTLTVEPCELQGSGLTSLQQAALAVHNFTKVCLPVCFVALPKTLFTPPRANHCTAPSSVAAQPSRSCTTPLVTLLPRPSTV